LYVLIIREKKNWGTENSKGNKTVPAKVATTCTADGHKWAQTDYQSRHCAIDRKDEGTWDDRRRDGLTRFTSRFRKQATRLATPPPFFNMMMMMIIRVYKPEDSKELMYDEQQYY
jgi:hypothetical protein